jgi:hypothetical protein
MQRFYLYLFRFLCFLTSMEKRGRGSGRGRFDGENG